jgi:Protein of unknown function (DUF2735)
MSAQIYQFPARGRAAATRRDELQTVKFSQRVANVVYGSAWYHEEALASEHTDKKDQTK